MTISRHEEEPLGDDPLNEAILWFALLKSGQVTPADADEFALWRQKSPAHEEAFQQLVRLSSRTRRLIEHPPSQVDRRALLAGGAGVIVAAGALGLVRPPLKLWPSLAELMADHRTGAGGRYAFAPTEGVSVDMNTRTSVSTQDKGQALTLITGETFITVKRSVPFVVQALETHITATDARFNVQAIDGALGVVCVEGEVICRRAGTELRLQPAEQLRIGSGGRMKRETTDPGISTSWRQGFLVFEGTPLPEVIRQINRYRSSDIILANKALSNRKVDAVLHIANIDEAINQLQQSFALHVQRLPGGVIVIR